MSLAADRNTPSRDGSDRIVPVAAGMVIFAGALVALDAGYAKPGTTATGLKALGRAEEHVDNTAGANGDVSITVRRGVFRFENSAGADEITTADLGGTAYIVDDATVAKTDGTATRSPAGTIFDVDAEGVWLEI